MPTAFAPDGRAPLLWIERSRGTKMATQKKNVQDEHKMDGTDTKLNENRENVRQ